MASPQPALRQSHEAHLHILGETCPVCEQSIPNDRAEAVQARMEARERALADAADARAAQQIQAEKARIEAAASASIQQARAEHVDALQRQAEEGAAREEAARAAAKSEVEAGLLPRLEAAEQGRRDAAAEIEQLKMQATAREAAAREEATKTAEQVASVRIEAAEVARQEMEAMLRGQLAKETQAREDAEESKAALAGQLAKLTADSEATLAKAAQETAEREQMIRAEATRTAEEAMRAKLIAAEQGKQAAEQARSESQSSSQEQLAAMTEQMQSLKEGHAGELNQQREALEKDGLVKLNAERAQKLELQMRLEGQLQDMQRQLQKKTADELGEGAELELYDVLKGAFEGDKIRRVPRGTPGADIIHEIVENGSVCGKIVYDSKNRNDWKTAYATKLREDQITEKADHAILSSNKFPAGTRQLHLFEHVIIACPARVLALAELLRSSIIQMHELRISNEEREEKSAALYAYITSEHCSQLLDSVETLIRKLEQMEVDEQKAHGTVWKKRGELLKAVLKANGNLRYELDRIIGTAEEGA
jgi:hypothetical protein